MNVTLAIAMHKPYKVPRAAMYLPIHVGAALHPDVLSRITQDDTGDNISYLNPCFSELTAQYWMWKNDDSEYKGIVHYRRYFATWNPFKWISRNRYDRIVSPVELVKKLSKCGMVLPAKRHYYIETIYSHYAHTLHAEQLHATRDALAEIAPDYVETWDEVMQKRSLHLYNMMVMNREDFDSYSAWLFPVLFDTIKKLDPACFNAFEARYPGRVSEILLNVWVQKNGKEYGTLPTTFSEKINWPKKILSFLNAKFKNEKYYKSFS